MNKTISPNILDLSIKNYKDAYKTNIKLKKIIGFTNFESDSINLKNLQALPSNIKLIESKIIILNFQNECFETIISSFNDENDSPKADTDKRNSLKNDKIKLLKLRKLIERKSVLIELNTAKGDITQKINEIIYDIPSSETWNKKVIVKTNNDNSFTINMESDDNMGIIIKKINNKLKLQGLGTINHFKYREQIITSKHYDVFRVYIETSDNDEIITIETYPAWKKILNVKINGDSYNFDIELTDSMSLSDFLHELNNMLSIKKYTNTDIFYINNTPIDNNQDFMLMKNNIHTNENHTITINSFQSNTITINIKNTKDSFTINFNEKIQFETLINIINDELTLKNYDEISIFENNNTIINGERDSYSIFVKNVKSGMIMVYVDGKWEREFTILVEDTSIVLKTIITNNTKYIDFITYINTELEKYNYEHIIQFMYDNQIYTETEFDTFKNMIFTSNWSYIYIKSLRKVSSWTKQLEVIVKNDPMKISTDINEKTVFSDIITTINNNLKGKYDDIHFFKCIVDDDEMIINNDESFSKFVDHFYGDEISTIEVIGSWVVEIKLFVDGGVTKNYQIYLKNTVSFDEWMEIINDKLQVNGFNAITFFTHDTVIVNDKISFSAFKIAVRTTNVLRIDVIGKWDHNVETYIQNIGMYDIAINQNITYNKFIQQINDYISSSSVTSKYIVNKFYIYDTEINSSNFDIFIESALLLNQTGERININVKM